MRYLAGLCRCSVLRREKLTQLGETATLLSAGTGCEDVAERMLTATVPFEKEHSLVQALRSSRTVGCTNSM
jgi:hypothetical protein